MNKKRRPRRLRDRRVPTVSAILVDVGGTLWSEQSTVSVEALRAERDQRLPAAGVSAERITALSAALAERVRDADRLDYLDVSAAVEQACVAAGVLDVSAEAIRHANSLPQRPSRDCCRATIKSKRVRILNGCRLTNYRSPQAQSLVVPACLDHN